jgi:hypothetical protein
MQPISNRSLQFYFLPPAVSTPGLEKSSHELDQVFTSASELEYSSLPEDSASLSNAVQDIQVNIGKHLKIRDALRLGQVSQNLNRAMSMVVTDYKARIKAPETLTTDPIACFTKIRNLHLIVPNPNEENMQVIKQLTNLQQLVFQMTFNSSRMVTDAALQYLSGLINLRTLDLSYSKVSDVGLLHLSNLIHLQTLYLQSTGVTGAGLQPLSGLIHLRTLHLSGAKVNIA